MNVQRGMLGILVALTVLAAPTVSWLSSDVAAAHRSRDGEEDDYAESCDSRKGEEFCSGQVIVRLKSGVMIEGFLAALLEEDDIAATVLDSILLQSIYLLDVTTEDNEEDIIQMIEELEDDEGASLVSWAELNYVGNSPAGNPSRFFPRSLADPQPAQDGNSWGKQDVKASAAAQCKTGNGVTVAVIDTGADVSHAMLSSHIAGAWNAFSQQPGQVMDVGDGIDNDGDGATDETAGHGTHVSGIVLQVAPNATVMPIKALDSDGNGNAFIVARAIFHAVDAEANVINLSLGTTEPSKALKNSVDYAQQHGVIVVAAAGNSGAGGAAEYPAKLAGVISVGATNAKGKPAASTRRAPVGFNTTNSDIDISAPGMEIKSAFPNGVQDVNTGFASWSGTSMAAPWVSGAIALLVEQHAGITADQAIATIGQTANPIKKVRGMGAGRLDAAAAIGCS